MACVVHAHLLTVLTQVSIAVCASEPLAVYWLNTSVAYGRVVLDGLKIDYVQGTISAASVSASHISVTVGGEKANL